MSVFNGNLIYNFKLRFIIFFILIFNCFVHLTTTRSFLHSIPFLLLTQVAIATVTFYCKTRSCTRQKKCKGIPSCASSPLETLKVRFFIESQTFQCTCTPDYIIPFTCIFILTIGFISLPALYTCIHWSRASLHFILINEILTSWIIIRVSKRIIWA